MKTKLQISTGRKNISKHRESLPALPDLLVSGGDKRIAINPETGYNHYYCQPAPDLLLRTYGSTTASSISFRSYQKLEQMHDRLLHRNNHTPLHQIYAEEMDRIRRALLDLCGFKEKSDVELIFAASGTDLHYIAALLDRQMGKYPPLVIMVSPTESGTGIPDALSGKSLSFGKNTDSFSSSGTSSSQNLKPDVLFVQLRREDGSLRPSLEIDSEFELLAKKGALHNRRVLIVMTDISKSGCLSPTPACALALLEKFPEKVTILVDACQFRIAPETLKAYLGAGCMVALTGSKFLTGPAFSGVLFLPPQLSFRYRSFPLPQELKSISAISYWPVDWPGVSLLPPIPNFGLLFRWEAALEELRAFRTLHGPSVMNFMQKFRNAILERLEGDPAFSPLPVTGMDRSPLSRSTDWDSIQTIFPFQLFHARTDHKPLSMAQTVQIYQQLQYLPFQSGRALAVNEQKGAAKTRLQFGQPVSWGSNHTDPPGALRLSLSSRLIVESLQDESSEAGKVIERTLEALDNVSAYVHDFK
ncbi:MAG: hypothetical protein KGI54_09850 [Pseudomonadota bacterium]|nr:hypothetical protein [Pseudomonadota bacterium]